MALLPDIWRDDILDSFASPSRALSSWRPILRQLDDFFNDAVGQMATTTDTGVGAPACDYDETDDGYLLSFDMPGLDTKDINLEVQGNRLLVSGERKDEREHGEGRGRFMGRRYSRFERAVTLPSDVKADQVDATYKNGVLKVAIPKVEESKRVKIKIGDGKGGLFQNFLGVRRRVSREKGRST